MQRIAVIDLFILLLVLIAAPQDSISASIGSSFLVLITMTAILVYGIPDVRWILEDFLPSPSREIPALVVLIVPYLIILLTGGSGLNEILLFLIWYALPTILFLISGRMESKSSVLRFILVIAAATFLWIGFDHRYTKYLFTGYSDDYIFNALWMAAVGLTSYSVGIVTENDFDRGIYPTKEGGKIANIATPLASMIVVPFGLITGFLTWNPQINLSNILIGFIGIFLTISLQEEMIFRGMALHEIDMLTSGKPQGVSYLSLILVSALFALTHWNNETPKYVWHYFFAAFIAGIAYGISYRKGGMFGAMLSHTLVDWIWAIFLKRV